MKQLDLLAWRPSDTWSNLPGEWERRQAVKREGLALMRSGVTCRAAAKKVGISEGTLRKFARQQGWERPKPQRRVLALALVQQGVGVKSAALRVGYKNPNHIRAWLREQEIELVPSGSLSAWELDARNASIRGLLREGLSVYRVAFHVGCSSRTVQRVKHAEKCRQERRDQEALRQRAARQADRQAVEGVGAHGLPSGIPDGARTKTALDSRNQ